MQLRALVQLAAKTERVAFSREEQVAEGCNSLTEDRSTQQRAVSNQLLLAVCPVGGKSRVGLRHSGVQKTIFERRAGETIARKAVSLCVQERRYLGNRKSRELWRTST